MTPTLAIISRVLALPLEARRALAEQPGGGWWAAALASPDNPGPWLLPERPPGSLARITALPEAWLPADPLAWLRAAVAGTGLTWEVTPGCARILRPQPAAVEGLPTIVVQAPTPEECALAYWKARR